MKRIFIETQSNRLFRGNRMQQDYDQRGGFCQIGHGHALITTDPIDVDFLAYWKTLGFTIPHIIVAGPFDPQYTLSELILQKPDVQQAVKAFASATPARLEFYYVEGHEAELSRVLGIPGYCNFDLSRRLARKIQFKKVCEELSLPNPSYISPDDLDQLFIEAQRLIESGNQVLLKADDGSGGLAAGGMFKAGNLEEFHEIIPSIKHAEVNFLLEPVLTNITEVSIHWEITEDGTLHFLGIFDRILDGFSYCGGSYPDTLPPAVRNLMLSHLTEKVGPYLVSQGGRGYFHCDIIITEQGIPLWTDFNPRKGGLIYIWDMVRRFTAMHWQLPDFHFWHETFHLPPEIGPRSFHDIAKVLSDCLHPENNPVVIITNPAIINFGHLDMTGISTSSTTEARKAVKEAKRRLTTL